MDALVTSGAGFLLAVLWFDLMFDVQARGHAGADVPEPVLASIAGYYRRVTTEARPMNRLVALAMVAVIAGLVVQGTGSEVPRWVTLASFATAAPPMGLAGARTVPNAVRLGTRRDPMAVQSRLARSILGDHLFCLASISALLVIQLAWA